MRSCLLVLAQCSIGKSFFLFGVPIVSANSSRDPTRNDDTDGELGNAACPSIAAEDFSSLLE